MYGKLAASFVRLVLALWDFGLNVAEALRGGDRP